MPDVGGCVWLVEAFYELSTTRQITMGGASSIPVTAIWTYEDRYLSPAWFGEAIRRIDNAWLEAVNKDGNAK